MPAGLTVRRGTAMDNHSSGPSRRGDGAHIGTRTQDLFLTKEVLCQLSYVGPRPQITGERWWAGRESNPHSRKTADLQSAELTTCSTYPLTAAPDIAAARGAPGADLFDWSRRRDSNPEPAVYKTAALPIELRRQKCGSGPYRRQAPWRLRMIGSVHGTGQARCPRRAAVTSTSGKQIAPIPGRRG